ncbi:MAG TPA: hypothetical protein VGP76_29675 [Planctomycetaceae bacterium]|nr:hypothetical protein [Planctomycetaceae bacterium]
MTPGRFRIESRAPRSVISGLVRTGLIAAVRASVALAISLSVLDFARADSVAPPQPQKPRLLFVDADHPSTWPKGLEPIPAGELRRLLGTDKDAESEPATVQIEQAVYQATFHNGSLIEGRAELTLGESRRPALVPLEHSHLEPFRLLDFSHLHWQGARDQDSAAAKDAVLCGIDRTGRRVVIADPGHSRLESNWGLAGRSSLGATEFAMCLPPAVVSQLVLRVPAELSVECDQGVLVRGAKDADGHSALWQLELGSRSSCRLRIIAPAASAQQHVFYDQDTTLVVAADRLRLQSKLQLEVFGAPLRTLHLAIPAGLRVETISYGDDFPLQVPANAADKAREISLDLPEPLLGKGRTLTVEASAATRANQLANLSQVGVLGAVRREGQVQLTIRAPLKLVRFGNDAALAQTEAPIYSIDGEETFFLHQNAGDPPLGIELAELAPVLAAQTQARLDLRRDRCAFAAEVVCSASRGSTFSLAFELPDAWDVTRVEAVGDVSRMIDETTRPVAEHRKRVRIDFFRAVTERESKRFRIVASRPFPRSGEAIDVPVIEFPAFASQKVETLVVHGSSIELGLSPTNAFAKFDPRAILSVLADSPLKPDRPAAEQQMLTHRWTGLNAKAHIILRRGEEILSARVQTVVEVGAEHQVTERVNATIVPTSTIDRLLVYLSTEGSQFAWNILTDQERPVEGTRLAADRHAEWNLPAGGELWDIRLPEPCRKEFQLKGTRRASSLGGTKIGLAFIPGGRTFEGSAELHLYDARQFDIESHDTHATSRPAGGDPNVRSFRYDRPGDVLVVRPRSTGLSNSARRFASLQLTTYLNAACADDLHRATFSIAPELVPQPFHFRLAADSRLCSVAVNGQPVRVQRRDDDVTVPSLPIDAWNSVEIEYKTTASGRLFRESRAIVFPRAQAEVLGFHWRVFLAPGLQPGGLSSGVRFDRPLPTLSWAERLFGPLGRSAAQMRLSFLQPDAWIVDLAGVDPQSETWAPQDRGRPPAGWSRWDASAEEVPAEINLMLWHTDKFRTLAWVICLGTLSVGFAVLRLATRMAQRLGPLAVAAAIALSLAAPTPYALLAGACVSGALLAALLSRPRKAEPARPTERRESRSGSTASFELRAVGMLLALGTLGAMAAFGQEPLLPPVRVPLREGQLPPSEARRPQPVSEGDFLVVVPVRPGQLASMPALSLPDDKDLVYVAPKTLEALRRRTPETLRNEGMILLSSDYAILLDERQPATIEATYHVAVMPGPARALLLRLGAVTLAGANACRVNGRPFPIRKHDDGFVLSLDSDVPPRDIAPASVASGSASLRRPIAAERPSPVITTHAESAANAGSNRPRLYEIRLNLFPSGETKPGQFEIQVPETARTAVRVEKSGPGQVVTLETTAENARRLLAGEPSVEVGQTNRMHFKAGPPLTETTNATIAAQAVQFLRVSPGLVEMDCRVTYDRKSGAHERFTWLVPANAAARANSDTYRAALRMRSPLEIGRIRAQDTSTSRPQVSETAAPDAEQLVPLDFDCSGAPSGPLTIAATLLLPIDPTQVTSGAPSLNVRLPRFDGAGVDQAGIRLTSNQVGISSAAGYRVVAMTTEPNLSHTPKADLTFRQESFGTHKEPDLIFDGEGISVLPLQLAAIVPTDKVRLMTHEVHLSADRIQWKTTAEIRTENAPAFVHALRVDPRLKIESASVREDDVERLVRFSQTGDEVTLFLRDRAAATQDLILTGRLPLEAGHATRLPGVSLVHAVVSDVRLAISNDPDVDVTVSDSPGVARVNIGGPSTQRDASSGTMPGIREYSISAGATMPEIRVRRRSEAAQTAPSLGAAAKNVKLSPAPTPQSTKRAESSLERSEQKPRVDVVAILELRRDRSMAGATHVLLERFAEPTLRLKWPASTVLRGALLDGRPARPMVADGWIAFALPSEPIPHRIALYWESRANSSLWALSRVREDLPVPADGLVSSILLSVVAPPGFRLWAPAHFTPLDPPTFAGLCDAIQSSDHTSPAGQIAGVTRIASAQAAPESPLMGRLGVGPTDATLSAWAIDTFWLRLPLAAAIFALIGLAAAHPFAARAGGWLLDRAALTVALIGLTWWFCLAPLAVGPLLLMIALAMLIVELRRRQPSNSRGLPSTLQLPSKVDVR